MKQKCACGWNKTVRCKDLLQSDAKRTSTRCVIPALRGKSNGDLTIHDCIKEQRKI